MNLRSLPLVGRLPGTPSNALPLVLEIDLARGLAEQEPEDPLSALRLRNTPTLGQVLRGLRHAARDDRVRAVVLLLGAPVTTTHADELATALRDVSAAGTRTVAFAESYGEVVAGTLSYALATACDEVWIQPSGAVGLTGISVSVTLLRGALDKLGIEPQFGQRHEYKTAANQFTAPAVTDAQREMMQRLAESVMEQARAAIATRRGMHVDQVEAAVAASPVEAAHALELGLVDRVGYRDEVYASLRSSVGRDGEVEQLFVHRYAHRVESKPARQLKRRKDPVVAVVPVHGPITSGRSRTGGLGGRTAGSDTVVAALESVHEREEVRAVVLHVDSPGGSYVASDAIRRAVQQLRATGRPVVASMGSVAASGGYFAAMNADRVLALPSTLTGSIGVLVGKFVLHQALDRVGVVSEAMATHPNATMFSTLQPFSDEQWQLLDRWLDQVYDDFTGKAAEDRAMPHDQLEPLARGRVWTGADAAEHHLVDELGGRQRAVQVACELAGLDRDRIRLSTVPHVPMLERFRPADSTRSPAASTAAALPSGPEGLLSALARDLLGGALPGGVLSLPWTMHVG